MLTNSWPGAKLGATTSPQSKRNGTKVDGAIRAEALSSAIFYSECTLNRISKDGASDAEDVARSNHSKWWLPGHDPNHPSLQNRRATSEEGCQSSSLAIETDEDCTKVPHPPDAIPEITRALHRASTDLGAEEEDNVQEGNEVTAEGNDANAPLFARDDDLGNIASLHFLPKSKQSRNNLPCHKASLTHVPYGQRTRAVSASTVNYKAEGDRLKQFFGTLEDVTRARHLHSSTQGSFNKSTHSRDDHSLHCSDKARSSNITFVDLNRSKTNASVSNDQMRTSDEENLKFKMIEAKSKLLSSLKVKGAGTTDPSFLEALAALENLYLTNMSLASPAKKAKPSPSNTTEQHPGIDGTWLMISPPSYPACLGLNSNGERMFSLGRMTFDMFQPADLVCSIQMQYNTIKTVRRDETLPVYIPPSLRQEVEYEHNKHGCGNLKTHNIIASFTIERKNANEDASSQAKQHKKLQGILTNYGYTLPDPENPNRNSIWFTSGTIEPVDKESLEEWKALFGDKNSPDAARTQYTEKARSLASTILLGAVYEPMDESGTAGYYLKQPIGGHNYAYCDTVFMDAEIRIMRGHSGSVFVFQRVELDD